MIALNDRTIQPEDQVIHKTNIKKAFEILATGEAGLSQTEAKERLAKYGLNVIRKIKGKPLYIKLLGNFTHLMAILLWVGGLAAFAARMPQLGIAVWMVNLINGAFSFWQEFRAEKATEALKQLLPATARVLRGGVEQKVLAEELVPGDIMLLAEGESISADGRLVAEAELRCDQSTLTGESRPVEKGIDPVLQEGLSYTEIPNLVFAGTHVSSGTGKAIVVSTGMNTEFGKIANLTQSVGEELSPLQKEMVTVTKQVTVIAVGVGILFFILAILLAGVNLFESFIFALGMIVAFVPEGLLPTVTLALAMGTQRMAKRHALIKKLSAVETLGCTTVICTDKTGTLTQNEMTVKHIWLPAKNGNIHGRILSHSGVGYAPTGKILDGNRVLAVDEDQNLDNLLAAAGLCNDARLVPPVNDEKTGKDKTSRWSILGDPTEAALLVAAKGGGMDLELKEKELPRLREIPFDSRRKRMSTIHQMGGIGWSSSDARREIAFIKGAPKEVLDLCEKILVDGEEQLLQSSIRHEIIGINDQFARNGLRVLAIAQRIIPERIGEYSSENIETNLTFLGLMALMDPPREEVANAVEKCHHAGIRIVMITGDYGLTAESIARRIGIVKTKNIRIVTGFDLDTMSQDELKKILHDEVIFARVAPEHKLRVVSALQELGHVIAVTGDGVNDAPALKKADIGVAMGITGSDVAKEAADMILTDDNFASIVNAIEEGRAVYDNIKKFSTYIFTSNTPEAIPFILFVLSGARIPLALNVMHVLAVDLGTDIVPALALGAEKPEPGVMNRPPRDLKDHVITKSMLLRAYTYLGLTQSLATMAAFYYFYWTNGFAGQWINLPGEGPLYESATAMALSAVVATQIGNLFTQRSEKESIFKISFFNNKMIWVGIATELAVISLIVYTPFMNHFIGTGPFPVHYWLFLFAWIPSLIVVDEFVKIFKRRAEIRKGNAK